MKDHSTRLWICVAAAIVVGAVQGRARAAAGTPDPCGLLTDGEVAALLGQPSKSRKPSDLRPGPTCTWRGASANLVVSVETEDSFKAFNAAHPDVRPIDLPPLERMKRFRKMLGANGIDVPGVGELAFWDKNGKQFWFFKNGRGVIINIDRHHSFGMADDLEGAKAAALKVVSKI